MAKAKVSLGQARILSAVIFGDLSLSVNQVVEAEPGVIGELVKGGNADDSPAAVKYCLNELKAKVVRLETPASSKAPEVSQPELQLEQDIVALKNEVTALESKLAEASEEEKAGIETQLDEKRKELAGLEG